VHKSYEVTVAEPLVGHEAEQFASGALLLHGETAPLLPAQLVVTGERTATVRLHEGRYHQVRRMFAAVGHHVVALHRAALGDLTLGGLAAGAWRVLEPAEVEALRASAGKAREA
jgi:16S rRNA pseudouridine516 synthase